MKIIINAYNLIIGGGLTVGKGITSSLFTLDTDDAIHVFLPQKKEYQFRSSKNITIHYIPLIFINYAVPRFFLHYYLNNIIRRLRPDRVFSLGNYALPVSCPQLLMLQWPYAVYPEKLIWSRMSLSGYLKRKLRLRLFRYNLKYATALTVQTEVMKARVKKYLHYEKEIFVVESSCTPIGDFSPDEEVLNFRKEGNEKLLLCMSEYYHHKNLAVLVPVAELIRKKKLGYRIILTIDIHKPGAAKLLKKIEEKNLSEVLINIGRISHERAPAIYHSCDALLLPTLLESFGIPYLEAALGKLPVITSDLDFAHVINGSAAWYFDPLSADSILAAIEKVFSDPEMLRKKTETAFENAGRVRTWKEITVRFMEILKSLSH